jgi:hypothetical protein
MFGRWRTQREKKSANKGVVSVSKVTSEKIKGYKGFDQNLKCQGFQYEVGKEYKHEGEVECCNSGFHFCENPIDVFFYYAPAGSRYCEVEGSGDIDRDSDDSKVACSELKIGREVGLKELIEAGVNFILGKVDWKNAKEANTGYQSAATNTGYQSAATNTGNRSAATNTGYQSAATNTGNRSAATNTGNRSAATNTGDWSAATNTGNRSAATNTGYQSAATNTGDWSAATNTGNQSAATNTGDRSAATNTGNWSAATNTGNRSAATNTGNQSAATNTGNWSVATNTGNWSVATNTGGWSAATVEGQESVAVATGYDSMAKGALGCWLVLAEWDRVGEHIVDVQCRRVDGNGIKPDTFYKLRGGMFVEVAIGNE